MLAGAKLTKISAITPPRYAKDAAATICQYITAATNAQGVAAANSFPRSSDERVQLHHSVAADIKRSSTEGAGANSGQSAAAAADAEAGAAARVCGDPRHPQICDAPAEDVYRDVHDHSVKEATGILQLK